MWSCICKLQIVGIGPEKLFKRRPDLSYELLLNLYQTYLYRVM